MYKFRAGDQGWARPAADLQRVILTRAAPMAHFSRIIKKNTHIGGTIVEPDTEDAVRRIPYFLRQPTYAVRIGAYARTIPVNAGGISGCIATLRR